MIAQTCRENLLSLTTAFAKATGRTLDGVSKQFYGNANFLKEYRENARSVSIDKYDEMVVALRQAWPKEEPWPAMKPITIKRRG